MKITVYISDLCPACDQLMAYLDALADKKVIKEYDVVDITKDHKAPEVIQALTGQMSTPTTVIGNEDKIMAFTGLAYSDIRRYIDKVSK